MGNETYTDQPNQVAPQAHLENEQPNFGSNPSTSSREETINIPSILREALTIFKQKIFLWMGLNLITIGIDLAVAAVFGPLIIICFVLKAPIWILAPTIVISLIIAFIVPTWSYMAFIYLLEHQGIKQAYSQTLRSLLPFLWLTILFATIVIGGVSLFVIPGIILGTWFIFAPILFIYEGERGFNALLKSKEYVKGNWWKIAICFFILGLLGFLVRLSQIPVNHFLSFIGGAYAWISSIFVAFLSPYTTVVTYLFYQKLKGSREEISYSPRATSKILLSLIAVFGNIFGIIALTAITFFVFKIQIISMPDHSMAPHLKIHQRLFVAESYIAKAQPTDGDIVAFVSSNGSHDVKRIIAIPGERISIKQGEVFINNIELDEIYLPSHATLTTPGLFLKESTIKIVPPNEYFVMGDNRLESTDSRIYGFIKKENIQGEVFSNPLDSILFNLTKSIAKNKTQRTALFAYPTPILTPPLTTTPSKSLWKQTANLPVKISRVAAVAHNDYVYVIGGYLTDSKQDVNTVYVAHINADGSINSWQQTTPLFETLERQTAIVDNGYLFLIGGDHLVSSDGVTDNTRPNNYVLYAQIHPDGTLGTWQTNATLPLHTFSPAVAIVNREMYVADGCGCDINTKFTYHDHIYPDEKLSVWDSFPSLPPLVFPKFFAFQNKLFALGHAATDMIPGGSRLLSYNYDATIYSTQVNSDGTIGQWGKEPSLPQPLDTDEKIVIDSTNRVFIHGASSTLNDMYVSQITGNGILSPWKAIQTGMWNRKSTGFAIDKNFIYLIGGKDLNDDTTAYNTVSFAKINADGSIVNP